MTNVFYSLILILLLNCAALSQSTMGGATANAYDMNTEIGGMVSEVDFTNYDPIGNVYLFEDWRSGNLTLKNGITTGNLVLRINLLNNSIDVKDKGKVRTFSIEKIEHVDISILADSTVRYFNPNEYQFSDKTPVIGLLRNVTSEGEWRLVERNFLKTYEANYVKALDAGTKQDRYEPNKESYLMRRGVIYSLVGSRKKFAQNLLLGQTETDALINFMKDNGVSNKRVEDLYRILTFLNGH